MSIIPYFNSFDLNLKGRIIYSEHDDGAWYINCLIVDSSNYEIFDQRASLDNFFIVQRNGFAVFYLSQKYYTGNYIEISGKDRELICYDNKMNYMSKEKLRLRRKFFFPHERINKIINLFEKNKKFTD